MFWVYPSCCLFALNKLSFFALNELSVKATICLVEFPTCFAGILLIASPWYLICSTTHRFPKVDLYRLNQVQVCYLGRGQKYCTGHVYLHQRFIMPDAPALILSGVESDRSVQVLAASFLSNVSVSLAAFGENKIRRGMRCIIWWFSFRWAFAVLMHRSHPRVLVLLSVLFVELTKGLFLHSLHVSILSLGGLLSSSDSKFVSGTWASTANYLLLPWHMCPEYALAMGCSRNQRLQVGC